MQTEYAGRMGKLEAERQTLAEALTAAERRAVEDKLRVDELQQAAKSARAATEAAKQEFQDYKSKASRILQVRSADLQVQTGHMIREEVGSLDEALLKIRDVKKSKRGALNTNSEYKLLVFIRKLRC